MKYLLIYIAILSGSLGFSQNENSANYFYAKVLGESVVLNFELRQGAICFGIQIQRRDEFSNFQQIGLIPGICGSEDYPESFVFTDSEPLRNQRSFYRLIFNSLGQSNELEVFVPGFNENDYVIAIEPNTQQLSVFFRNPLEQNVQLNLFSLRGDLLHQASSQTGFIPLPTAVFREKFLVFYIISEDRQFYISGKILLP